MKYYIELPLEKYLAQWITHAHDGSDIIEFPKGCVENKMLEIYITKQPNRQGKEETPGEAEIKIRIPCFRAKPPEIYHHMPKSGKSALVRVIRDRFDVKLWKDLHAMGVIGKRQDDMIYAWMDANGIECSEQNYNAITKRYQRLRKAYLDKKRKK